MEQHPPTPTETGDGYETSDVSPRGIVLLGSALVAVTVLASLMLYFLFGRLEQRAVQSDRPISPLAEGHEPAHGPLLEKNFSYAEGRKRDQAYLDSYGWVERKQEVVHMPIEQAMELIITEYEKR